MFRGLLASLRQGPTYGQVRDGLAGRAGPICILGPGDTAAAYVLATVAADERIGARPVLVVAPTQDAAARLADDLKSLLAGTELDVHLCPDAPGTGERLAVLDALAGAHSTVVVAPVSVCIEPLPAPEALARASLTVRAGAVLPRDGLVGHLESAGYERVALVASPGEFAVRGGIVDVFPPDTSGPVRLELWGDEVDSIRGLDPISQRSLDALQEITVRPARLASSDGPGVPLTAYLPEGGLLALVEPAEGEAAARMLAGRAARSQAEPELSALAGGLAATDGIAGQGTAGQGASGDRVARQGTVGNGIASDRMPPLEWEQFLRAATRARLLAIAAARPPEGAWHQVRFPASGIEAQGGQTHLLAQRLASLASEGLRVVIASAQASRLARILRDAGVDVVFLERIDDPPPLGGITAVPAALARGFRMDAAWLAVVTDAEVVGWRRRRPRMRFLRDGERLSSWADLAPGDLVVHLHHGIGRYRGLVRMAISGAEREYLLLEYAQEDRLYVPADQIHLVQRYIGAEGEQPRIHRLGGAEWDREKRRVKEAAREMAASLLALYAARTTVPGHQFAPDTPWQQEMEAAFPYAETPDQQQAIEDVKRDMEAPRPMDRLVAGDVGYGKTEVALRAAFKAVMDGKQVAVVVPTTVLAQQHFNVFSERFARFPVTVEMISRFRLPAEQKEVLARTAGGQVDVLIGTHRILGRDVRFRDLGLVIIDEEQRFGVSHKEHLKALRKSVDVLTLTATPIPRTLHMSLSGLRDMTVMETPPEARLPIHTEIRPEDDDLIHSAILRELARGGQVYVVHNRVQTIERAARRIRRLVPEARVSVAHGQMSEERLEQVMLDFLGGRCDVLVCTTIVEIGLDISQVNTILVEDAHLMGLAQLYQLRGRVGRADRQAYCYLLYPPGLPLTPEAEQRLRAMAEFVELGSGLGLAMRDLEIRGAGNILGPEQHGHVAAVGFDLYCRLLDEAIREARGEIVEEQRDPVLEIGERALLPHSYVPDERDRMSHYRRLAAARTADEVEAVAADLVEQFGPLPPEAGALLDVARLRVAARGAGIASVTRQNGRFAVRFGEATAMDDALLERLRLAMGSRAQVTAAGFVMKAAGHSLADQVAALREAMALVGRLTARAAAGETEGGRAPARTAG